MLLYNSANGVAGTGREFSTTNHEVSLDGLLNIENVKATIGNDTVSGNSEDNTLDARGGDDTPRWWFWQRYAAGWQRHQYRELRQP